jgi:hypothetical protein
VAISGSAPARTSTPFTAPKPPPTAIATTAATIQFSPTTPVRGTSTDPINPARITLDITAMDPEETSILPVISGRVKAAASKSWMDMVPRMLRQFATVIKVSDVPGCSAKITMTSAVIATSPKRSRKRNQRGIR